MGFAKAQPILHRRGTEPPAALARPTRILRGDVYRQKGDLDRAIADYREALRLDPNNRVATQKLIEAERERT